MIPILYPATETEFETNGLGMLSDAIDATVEEELNGSYELEMEYPVKGIHFAEIAQRSIILAKPNPMTDPQPFRVYRITKPLSGKVKIYARHIAYDLKGITVSPFSIAGAASALNGLKNYAVTDCPFNFYTDKSAEGTMTVKVPSSIWSLLGGQEGSVLDVFGGEYEFDRYDITLRTQRGADRGVSIRYGKNLTSFEQDENCASCCTGLYPYWTDMDGNLVELPEKVIRAEGNFGYEDIRPMDFSGEWEEAPTEDQLRARTEKYISANDIGVPDVSWTVEFAALEQTEEYKGKALLERVLLGDTVTVEFPDMGVSASARAVAVKYKPLLDRYDKITLGRVKSNLAQTIVKQKQEIEKKPNSNTIQKAIDVATKDIIGAKGGSVRMLDNDGDGNVDTLYVADNADPALAQKVWRWNYEGWAASKTGYDGPFTMAATLEAGLLADFVTAAHLTAGTIQNIDGSLFIDLDNGVVRMQAIGEMEDKIEKQNEAIAKIDGAFFYVRYSQYEDGSGMTESPDADTQYMGTCSTSTHIAPTDPTAYTWVKVRGTDGKDGANGTPGSPGADGKTSYLHIKYSDDGETFTANNGEELGAYIGTLVDFEPLDSTTFSDYTWKKFTEDVDEELDEIKRTIQEQYTQILNDSEQIVLSALESYVETGDYEEFKKTTESQLQLLSDEMTLKFEETTSQIEEVNGDLQTKFNTITKYFTFDINGLTIGASDNPNKVVIDNDEISILVNGVVVQRFDANGKALTPDLEITRSLRLFGYLIEEDADGNIGCEYIGAAELKILTQPSDQTVAVGETASFTVKAQGIGLSYQWQYKNSTTRKWASTTKDNAKTATFTITPSNTSIDGELVRCVITDANDVQVISNTATLHVTG